MPFSYYNPNPQRNNTRDCAVRAVAKALNVDWDNAFARISVKAFEMKDTMDCNAVWGAVLKQNGFYKDVIPNTCPDCYTVKDFCRDYPNGTFVLGFGDHTATVIDGILYDSWDSSALLPVYFWYRYKEDIKNDKEELENATEKSD